ncbi:MAG TPA: type II toxin-antitoxin system VapC family toxin [Opitutaceae bacterium]|jgi:predicted nucleic acid-binding protein|nr:type II toxin-antitoxin system VapC family toxin [Opitutaceae bacterium]
MYVDTSILVKLLVFESDSDDCARKMRGAALVSSELIRVEVLSTLLRKEREGTITTARRESAWKEFGSILVRGDLTLEPLGRTIVQRAQELLFGLELRVPIRILDALHLATALSAIAGPIFTADRRMREAAALLGMSTVA